MDWLSQRSVGGSGPPVVAVGGVYECLSIERDGGRPSCQRGLFVVFPGRAAGRRRSDRPHAALNMPVCLLLIKRQRNISPRV